MKKIVTIVLFVALLVLSISALLGKKDPVKVDAEANYKGFQANIEQETLQNNDYRRVLYTGENSQLVLMSLKPKEEIGMETHEDSDQFFRIEKGTGKSIIDGNEYELGSGTAIVVPAGAQHNIVNTSDTEEMKLYTIYSPPQHKDGIVRSTKEEAEKNQAEFDGQTTE